jgi:hypothetical protein
MLSDPHRYVSGGVLWGVRPAGMGINGSLPVGTSRPPDTVRRVLGWFGTELETAATVYSVPKILLVAILCNEAAGGQTDRNDVCLARREEPGCISDETTPGRVGTGCCQTLLSTARDVLHRPGLTSADLESPAISLMAAAAYIAVQFPLTRYDPVFVSAGYNAGGLHPEPTLHNRWGLRCYPSGTGEYIDRFVLWYNDAAGVLTPP